LRHNGIHSKPVDAHGDPLVKDRGEGQKDIWTRIGAAWPHGSGNGLSIQLDALPLDGRIVLTEPKAE
jgi:hypothetical protein